MTQTAKVKRILGAGLAEVAVKRVSACAHDCSKCASGGCMMMEHPDLTVKAYKHQDAQVGDMVMVESSTKQILSLAAVVYLLHFALFFAGYIVAACLGQGENTCLLVGGVCFAFSFLISLALNRVTQKKAVHYSIVKILGRF